MLAPQREIANSMLIPYRRSTMPLGVRSHAKRAAPMNGKLIAAWSSACLIVLAGTSACSTSGEPERARPAPRVATSGTASASARALPSAAYFAQATAADLFLVRAADIALQRPDSGVRGTALQLKQHHEGLAAQMSLSGRRLNLLPSRVLPAEYQQMLAALRLAGDFDRTYLAQQRQVLARALRLHQAYARAGQSPTLRPVAQFGATTISGELKRLGR
jgi:predicted outer membrane protein